MEYEKLCLLVQGKGKEKRVPGLRKLTSGEENIVFSTSKDFKNGLFIYENGYVIFSECGKSTVFAMVTFWFKKGVLDETGFYPTKEHMKDPYMNRTDVYGIPTWVYLLCDFGRKRILHTEQVRLRLIDTEEFEQVMDHLEPVPSYEEEYLQKEMVRDLLSCLTESQRKVIHLHFWEGYSYEEIAESFNIQYFTEYLNGERKKEKTVTRQAVGQMAMRALARMREKMEKDY